MKYYVSLLFAILVCTSFSSKTKNNSKACIGTLYTLNGRSFNITFSFWGSGNVGGTCSVNYSKVILASNSASEAPSTSCGSLNNGLIGNGGSIQSSGSPFTGSIDIYSRNGTGQTFIKTVTFSNPSNIQYFSLDGQFHCFGYNFYFH